MSGEQNRWLGSDPELEDGLVVVKLWTLRWLAGVYRIWTAEEVGVYVNLMVVWAQHGPLPENTERLARCANIEKERFIALWNADDDVSFSIRKHFVLTDLGWEPIADEPIADPRLVADPGRNPRSARERAARKLGTHTEAEWHALLDEFGCVCVACGRCVPLTKDHIIPISVGGSDSIENIQPLCQPCNSSKGTNSTDWLAARRAVRLDGSSET